MNKTIFIAIDTDNIRVAKKIIYQTQNNKLDIGYKFGLEFFYSKDGRKFISKIKSKKIFLDLKLNDIPATCSKAVKSIKDLKNINFQNLNMDNYKETLKYSYLNIAFKVLVIVAFVLFIIFYFIYVSISYPVFITGKYGYS